MKPILAALLLLPALLSHASAETNTKQVTVASKLETIRDDAKRERTETIGYRMAIDLRAASSVSGELKVVTVIFGKKLPGNNTVERNLVYDHDRTGIARDLPPVGKLSSLRENHHIIAWKEAPA